MLNAKQQIMAQISPKINARIKYEWLVGIDEVGRGPLAGPVTVGLFAIKIPEGLKNTNVLGLSNDRKIFSNFIKKIGGQKLEIDDSKKMSEISRQETYEFFKKKFNELKNKEKNRNRNTDKNNSDFYFSVMHMSSEQIDKQGIAVCIQKLVDRNLRKLFSMIPQSDIYAVLDGGLKTRLVPYKSYIKGDGKFKVIGTASIMAKVTRDSLMNQLSKRYPDYCFDQHKGYGTKKHILAIKKFGPSEIHRNTFLTRIFKRPVVSALL